MRKDEKKILKLSIFAFLCFEFVLFCLFAYMHYKKYHYLDNGDVIASINKVNIHSMDIEARLNSFFDGNRDLSLNDLDKDVFIAMMLEKYSDKIIVDLAKKKGMFNNNYYKFITKEYFERLVRDEYLEKYVFGKITEQDVEKRYEYLVSLIENKEERKISHILVDTEDEAKRIRNSILRFNNFEKMAKQRSKDKFSAINDGCLGYLMKEEITIKEFADVAFLLKIAELSKPIKTSEGWHIIKIDDIRNIKIKSFEESRDEIYEELKHKEFENFVNSIVDKKDIENIKIFVELKQKSESDDVANNNTDNINNLLEDEERDDK